MKNVILLFTVIGATFLMTSCMAGGETSYTGSPLSYITCTEMGTVYARTLDGLPITSPEIKMELPGSFVYVKYSWKESENSITEEGVYNATVMEISDPVDQSSLWPVAAPIEKEMCIRDSDLYKIFHTIILIFYILVYGIFDV